MAPLTATIAPVSRATTIISVQRVRFTSMPSDAADVSPNANESRRVALSSRTAPITTTAVPAIATSLHVEPASEPSSQLRISR